MRQVSQIIQDQYMKRLALVVLAALFFVACGPRAAQMEGTQVEIAQLLSNPAEFENQQVQFTGVISHICKHAGDKIKVAVPGEEGQAIVVKLGELAAQFTPEMVGKEITLSGLVTTKTCAKDHAAHGCGQAAPAAEGCCGTKPETCCQQAAAAAPADAATVPAEPVAEAVDTVAVQPKEKHCGEKANVYIQLSAFEVR